MSSGQPGLIADVILLVLTLAAVVTSLVQRRRARWIAVLVSLSAYWIWAGPVHGTLLGGMAPLGALVLGYLGLPWMLVVAVVVPTAHGTLLLRISFLLSAMTFVALIWALERSVRVG